MKIEMRIRRYTSGYWGLIARKFLFEVRPDFSKDFDCFDIEAMKATTTKNLKENKRFFQRFEKYLE